METSGLFFPKAITQIFAGLYLELVMLAALFFLANAPDGNGGTMQTAIPEGVFTIILLVLVIAFHYFLSNSYGPLYTALPLDAVPAAGADSLAVNGSHSPARTAVGGAPSHGGGDVEKQISAGGADSVVPSEIKGAEFAHGQEELDKSDPALLTAFDHPAVKDGQRALWFPNDRFGLGSAAVNAARKHELDATNDGTSYNDKNAIVVNRKEPPGEPVSD